MKTTVAMGSEQDGGFTFYADKDSSHEVRFGNFNGGDGHGLNTDSIVVGGYSIVPEPEQIILFLTGVGTLIIGPKLFNRKKKSN